MTPFLQHAPASPPEAPVTGAAGCGLPPGGGELSGNEAKPTAGLGAEDRGQRSGADRRKRMIPPLRYLVRGGRRQSVRRVEDYRGIVLLDRYSPKLFAAIVGILFLSLVDAVLTLYLIEHGAEELNPVMAYFLKKGPLIFTAAKYALTVFAVVIFLLVANSVVPRSGFRTRRLFPYALIAFGSVILWEFLLIFVLVLRS
jgi:hypothetical protein